MEVLVFMLKRFSLLALAIASLVFAATQAHPARAALIDKLIIKNDTSDSPIYYTIHKSVGIQEGCLRHRQTFNEGFVFQPKRVELRVYHRDCRVGSAVYDKTLNYWAPETTYEATGSQYDHSIKITAHH
ncbi:MAG: hypothetical protein JO233_08040 [Candidatus Eremiobacteraeota bacterium]|nr:hypothetical protein [Candidatus Eremiobacteraeota bacterium]